MKKLGLILIVAVAIVFAGCKKEMKKEDVQNFVNDLTTQIKNNKMDEVMKTAFADDVNDDMKAKFKEALMGQEFKIIDIKDDKVTLEVVGTAADGGQVTARTVIFKVIQIDGKIRLKDLVSSTPKTEAQSEGSVENANQEAPADDMAEIVDPEKEAENADME